MDGIAVVVCCKVEPIAALYDRFIEFRQQKHSFGWRLYRGEKQAVIPAFVAACDGGTAEATKAIGFYPFQLPCRFIVRQYRAGDFHIGSHADAHVMTKR